VRELAVEQEVGDLHEGRIFRELLDRVAAGKQYSLLAVALGDGAAAARRRGEARVVSEHPGLVVELADVDHFGADRAFEDRISMIGAVDPKGHRFVGHSFGSTIWSAMRARLSSLPNKASTSNIPGDVVRPVSAARSGWASLPSL